MSARKLWWLALIAVLWLSVLPAAAQEVTYRVKPGDTLASIAAFYRVSPDAILIRNNIIDPNRLRSGQTIIIPTGPLALPTTHTVQPGERLADIAARYNTTVEALQQANNLPNANRVTVGTVLNLPAVGGPVPASLGQGGAQAPAAVPGPANFERLHLVDIGQDLRMIATMYGVTWQAIATRNALVDANRILAGQQLIIPAVNPPFGTGGPVVTPTPQPPAALPAPILPRRVVNGVYRVQAGDNLFAIAGELGVDIYTIARANGLLNLNAIFTGQALVIPGR